MDKVDKVDRREQEEISPGRLSLVGSDGTTATKGEEIVGISVRTEQAEVPNGK